MNNEGIPTELRDAHCWVEFRWRVDTLQSVC
jgi:hypothetical protein